MKWPFVAPYNGKKCPRWNYKLTQDGWLSFYLYSYKTAVALQIAVALYILI